MYKETGILISPTLMCFGIVVSRKVTMKVFVFRLPPDSFLTVILKMSMTPCDSSPSGRQRATAVRSHSSRFPATQEYWATRKWTVLQTRERTARLSPTTSASSYQKHTGKPMPTSTDSGSSNGTLTTRADIYILSNQTSQKNSNNTIGLEHRRC